MKINFPVRMKNPWFWVSLLGVVLTAMGVSPEMFTNWNTVIQAIKDLIGNPYMLFSVTLAVMGVFIDPTTAGVGDSNQALTYTAPKKEDK